MHAVLTPVGSSGDVNPFVVVGRELRRRGHRVTLLAPDLFAHLASNADLEFVSVGTAEEFEHATNNPDLWNPRRGVKVVFHEIAPRLRRAYAALDEVYEPNQTMLVGHSLSLFTRVFEELHRVPAVTIHLAPAVFRSDFRPPALPSGPDISTWPRWARRMLWWGIDRFAIDPLIAPALNAWRAELGLAPVSRVLKSWFNSPQRVLGLFPDWFGDPQPDWPSQLQCTGFVLSDEYCAPDEAQPAAPTVLPSSTGVLPSSTEYRVPSTEEYLSSGDAPIVFTPGSANRHASQFFRAAIDATARIGRRALLVTSYSDHLPPSLPEHAHHVTYASFATLFPRAAAVVHHGGIGTSAQALAAGVPQLVMPMGFDQPDNAVRLRALGVAETILPGRFTAPRVAAALERLLTADDVSAACRRCRERFDGAKAVERVCDLIEEQHRLFTGRIGDMA